MLKQANLSFSVAAQSFGDDVTSIQFSTLDRNTAKLVFTIKNGKEPLNLTDVEAQVDLVMGDKSIFEDNKAKVTSPLDGKLEYTITPEQIRHPGRARGELQLTFKDGQSLGGFRFNFTIKKALVDEYAGPVKEYYVQDLEAIKAEIRKTADSIKDLDVVRIDTKLNELEQKVEEGGVGVDEQARQGIQDVTKQLAENVSLIEEEAKGNRTPKGRKSDGSMVTFITDDAYKEDMTIFRPIFNKLEVPFCTGAVPSWVQGKFAGTTYCTIDDLKTLESEGHEILSHSYYHQILDTLTDAELDIEMRESKEYLVNQGLKVKNFVTPYGRYDDRVRLLGQKYYRSLRLSEGYYNSKPVESFALKGIWIVNETQVDTLSGFPRNSFEHYKYFIDQAVANKHWLIISTHSWEIRDWGNSALLEQIVSYAKLKSKVVTVDQALDKTENLMESALFSRREPFREHFAVSSDGKVTSNLMFFKKLETNSVSANTPLSAFEPSVVSVCNILSGSNATGLPESKAGVLETYNFLRPETTGSTDLGFAYQTYRPYESRKIYTRTAMTNGSWSGWYFPTDDSPVIILAENSVTSSTPITSYTANKMTWCLVYGATAAMPNNKAGLLMTNRLGGNNHTYSYQEFHENGVNRVWRRSLNASGEWLAWWLPTDEMTVIKLADNAVNGTTAITSFAAGKITWCRLYGTTGTPNNRSGMLMTNRIGSSDSGYCWQEFAEHNSNNRYMRRCNSAGEWQPWMQYNMISI